MKKTFLALTMALMCASVFAAPSINVSAAQNDFSNDGIVFTSKVFTPSLSHHHHHWGPDLSDAISDLFFMAWCLDNFLVKFDAYPYASGDKYVSLTEWIPDVSASYEFDLGDSDDEDFIESAIMLSQQTNRYKAYRFELQLGAFAFPTQERNGGMVCGMEARVEGFAWKFFGPVFEYTVYSDSTHRYFEPNYLSSNLRLGIQFSIIHWNYFDWSWYLQWTRWDGDINHFEASNGIAFGSIVRMYPNKPVLLEWRYSIQDPTMDENYIFQSDLELGIMLVGRSQMYVDWRYVDDQYHGGLYNGVAAGLKWHF